MNYKILKLSQYAKLNAISYQTAHNRFKNNKIEGAYQDEFTSIFVKTPIEEKLINNKEVIIYSRVSSSKNKSNLLSQSNRLQDYAIKHGYKIIDVIEEIGSGLNDDRKKLNKILNRTDYSKIIVEHKDRLTRFGFNYIELFLNNSGREIEVVNKKDNHKYDLMEDFISILYSFSARMYGTRRAKKQTEIIVKELEK